MMIRAFISLLLMLQTLVTPTFSPETRTVFAMKSGVLLRMHVIAQDDSDAMQQLKLHVRDAVRQAYADAPEDGATMLARTQALLPLLTRTAEEAARAEGFAGDVTVSIEQADFDQRTLDGLTIPAGNYPALIIRLGDAQGHNWWGLIDPELSVACAAWEKADGWRWSLQAFFQALLGLNTGGDPA